MTIANDNHKIYYMICKHNDTSHCYDDGFDNLEELKESVSEWLGIQMYENGEYGSNEDYFTVYSEDQMTGEEKEETITLQWESENTKSDYEEHFSQNDYI